VEIPREMLASNDYVTPRLNGLKYFEKPPLFYWLQSASIKIFGINENSMRVWTVFFAILGCLSVFFVGCRCGSMPTGLLSSGILATNIMYYAHSRVIIIDMVVTALMCGALWCFFLAFVREHEPNKKSITMLMYVLSALACLTKGLIGAILPGFVAFLWIAITNNWKKLKEILNIPRILAFLAVFLPWHIAVCIKNDDFFFYYFVFEHFLRYTTDVHSRYQPEYFFLGISMFGFLPWTGFALVAIRNAVKKRVGHALSSEHIFLLCWIFGILAFFSFSQSKLIPYILPIFPPMAFLSGQMLARVPSTKSEDFRAGTWITAALFIIAAIYCFVVRRKISTIFQNQDVIALTSTFVALLVVSVAFLLFSIYSQKIKITVVIFMYMFIGANMLWIINKAAPYYQDIKKPSTREMAEVVKMNLTKEDLVFCYGDSYQDFPAYLNSTVGVVDYVGEMEFGKNAEKEKSKNILLTNDQFWNLWNTSNKRIFLLLSRDAHRDVFMTKSRIHKIIEFNKSFIVISNR
jgi:4-amino-4-deoxy-L-arabinose transferase-like glycosyltransferase